MVTNMGTRADFYIGEGKEAKWMGSIAWDGYQWDNNDNELVRCKTEGDFVKFMSSLEERDDFTKPEQGWPWPWDDSKTTDYAYCFCDGEIRVFVSGRPVSKEDSDEELSDKQDFPNMRSIGNVAFGNRSGMIIVGG
jgi:hypothetical protein